MTDNKKEGKAVGFFRSKIQRLFRHTFPNNHAVNEQVSHTHTSHDRRPRH